MSQATIKHVLKKTISNKCEGLIFFITLWQSSEIQLSPSMNLEREKAIYFFGFGLVLAWREPNFTDREIRVCVCYLC